MVWFAGVTVNSLNICDAACPYCNVPNCQMNGWSETPRRAAPLALSYLVRGDLVACAEYPNICKISSLFELTSFLACYEVILECLRFVLRCEFSVQIVHLSSRAMMWAAVFHNLWKYLPWPQIRRNYRWNPGIMMSSDALAVFEGLLTASPSKMRVRIW